MHELAIAQSIVEAIEAKAFECQATRVKCVRLKIGEASGIVGDSLAFNFEMLASLVPVLSGATLQIESLPHRAWCALCDKEFAVRNYIAQCPTCQEWSSNIISGTELQILDMEIEAPEKA
ncbi:MAG TPA: hydrogenase maturation nickel metallochaperone HypA [Ktedonobacteraceae bacterium]|nr:hydrogenase maturation nickel metallochaperone HypA [Ktedonobacteraceae bacterium]